MKQSISPLEGAWGDKARICIGESNATNKQTKCMAYGRWGRDGSWGLPSPGGEPETGAPTKHGPGLACFPSPRRQLPVARCQLPTPYVLWVGL